MRKTILFALVALLALPVSGFAQVPPPWILAPYTLLPADATHLGGVTIDGTGANSVMGSTTAGGVDTPRNAVALPSGSSFTWIPVSSATNAVQGANYIADTSGGPFTITLPASPATGGAIEIVDGAGTWGTNNLTVARNGQPIKSVAGDLVLNVNDANLTLVYYNGTYGWRILNMR